MQGSNSWERRQQEPEEAPLLGLVEDIMAAATAAENVACRKCSRALTPENSVPLWDGHRYCRDCVEATCPGLAGYALQHDKLEETGPFRPWAAIWGVVRLFAILWLALIAVLVLAGYRDFDIERIAGMVRALVCLSVPFMLLFSVFQVWASKQLRPTVVAISGTLKVSRRAWGWPTYASLISECRWYVGKAKADSGLLATTIPNVQAVVIEHPIAGEPLLFFNYQRAACGWTPEMRRIWIGFLTLAGVPRKE